jgi:DNA-binding response OmpR family regulator
VNRRARILIVEDEWLLASDIARRLEREGYEIVGPAPTVAQAFRLLDETPPQAAIMDVQLDGETTFSLAARLEQLAVPLLFLSGHPASDFAEQLESRTVLSKPADWRDVLKTLRKMLETP